jgi:MYXO-CTERM domain-containing protein
VVEDRSGDIDRMLAAINARTRTRAIASGDFEGDDDGCSVASGGTSGASLLTIALAPLLLLLRRRRRRETQTRRTYR